MLDDLRNSPPAARPVNACRAAHDVVSMADGECRLVHEYFALAARRWPDRVAVEVPPGRARAARAFTTYAQLARQSGALASRLRPDAAHEAIVGILLPRDSAHLYAAQLAVLEAGAAFVCVDPAFPGDRVRDILEDAEARVLITNGAGSARADREGFAPARVIDVEREPDAADEPPPADPSWLTPASLAYLMYTSGTSGRPKGVMIEHRSVAHLIATDLEAFDIAPHDRVGQGSSAAYDSSVEETWLAFAAGATLVVMDEETMRLGPDLVHWLRRERISVFCPPPTLLRAMGCDDPQSALPDLRLLYVGGEALPCDIADHWGKGRQLVNGYGPTECTVTCLREWVTPGNPISIGRPAPGVQAWVSSETLKQVPDGERGELCIGGVGLARGYWRRPDLTAERFVTLPAAGRVYRTGDLVQRDPDGRFYYHGRIDSQVKLRGYRVELGEIESHLARCAGVRAAACRVQDENGHATLAAWVVPDDPARPPQADDLRAALAAVLPNYMVPARFGLLPALPTTVGGKLDRSRLPSIEVSAAAADHGRVLPRDPFEARIEAAFAATLHCRTAVSVEEDFFTDLGGDSLGAAELVTRLRDDPATAWVTVRDVYEAPTVAALAKRAAAATGRKAAAGEDEPDSAQRRPWLVTAVQAGWLLSVASVAAGAGWWVGFEGLPWLTTELGLLWSIVAAPVIALVGYALYTLLAVLFAVAVKRLLVGRYRPRRTPVWSSFYLQNWIVQEAVRLVPWGTLEGTTLQQVALRALGARIGRRVHIHRGVDLLRGGWDLLDIGDDVTVGQDAFLRLVDFDHGDIVVGPVSLGVGATVDVRAGVAGHAALGAGAHLTALSSLPPGARIPDGERWSGIPATPAGPAAAPPSLPPDARVWSPGRHAVAMSAGRAGLGLLLALPLQVLAMGAVVASGANTEDLWAWISTPATTAAPWVAALAAAVLSVPLTLLWSSALIRMLGRVPEGTISRWSPAYVRVWLKTSLVQSAGNWLSGTLFWPVWLRWSGMKVGRGCEISTIIDVVPELITVGDESFFADGIYLGGPRIEQGRVTLARTSFGTNTFLGNHVVVPAGQTVPDDMLLGVCTPAEAGRMRPGSSWFGHPPFELPRRQVVTVDRRLTHQPSAIRFWNRVFWETLRFALPIVPLAVLVAWYRVLASAEPTGGLVFLTVVVLLATVGALLAPAAVAVALKWALLGRVAPGQHPLWSCWCSRWDFMYMAWGQYGRAVLGRLEGTLMLAWYLRAMGMKIGRLVVLGPGHAQVVDPDMIAIGDEATVNAMFQAHTFEDRVLKIHRIVVGRRATLGSATVPLYESVIGDGSHVAPHSVIMKREHLLPGVRYEGAPTRPAGQPG
jgi:non-ribosomal peptide synthetase-like protein